MNNRSNAIYAPESVAPGPLALREFDELYEEDEELFAWVDNFLEESAPRTQPLTTKTRAANTAQPSITERQMRALSRKHLLLMLRDLEKELLQVTRERDNMLTACRAGMAHVPQAYQAGYSYAQ